MTEAAAAPSLNDFFKSKGKKKIKAANLNKDPNTKPDEKKVKTKATEDDAWEEEKVEAATIKVEVAGKLMREDQKKEDEDTAAPAWGQNKQSKDTGGGYVQSLNDREKKKYPTLAKSVQNINIDDGSDAKVNITTSKNHFAALEGEEEDEEGAPKRPKEIKPAMVTKKKGEREKVALQREMDKYTTKKKPKKDKTDEDGSDEDEEEEDEEEEEGSEEEAAKEEAKQEARKKKLAEKKEDKKDDKKVKKPVEEEETKETEEDLLIQVDLEKSKEKYLGRKKLPTKDLPNEELEEEKENKPKPQPSGKKKKFVAEEETEKKLAYADW